MAVSVYTTTPIVQVGQRVRVYGGSNFNPPHFLYHSIVYSNVWHRGFIIPGVLSADPNKPQLQNTNQDWVHWIRHAAVLESFGGSIEYTLDTSQVHNYSNFEGANYSLVLKTPTGETALRVTFHQYNSFPSIVISTHQGVVEEYINDGITHFPAGTKVRLKYGSGRVEVILNDVTMLWQGVINSSLEWPLTFDYEYWPTAGSHADTTGIPEILFSEAKLTGGWIPYIPAQYQADESLWAVSFYDEDDVFIESVPGNTFVYGYEEGGGPYIEFPVPELPVGADYIKVTLTAQSARTHAIASTEIDLYEGGTDPDLVIEGPAVLVLEPGEVINVQVTGYTPADLTYEALGGGGAFGSGFTENQYTADTDAGSYSIRVTQGTRQATQTIIVRPRLYVDGVPLRDYAMVGGTNKTIASNFDVDDYATTGWNLTGGSLGSQAIRSVVFTAPNSTGLFEVYAETPMSSPYDVARINIQVTASGSVPSSGLRLEPGGGINQPANTIGTARMIGDPLVVVWATTANVRIDGSNNNLILQQNNAIAEALLANCFNQSGASGFVWQFNSLNLPDTIDVANYIWFLEDVQGHVVQYLWLEYLQSGASFKVHLIAENGSSVAEETFTATATTQLSIWTTDGANFNFDYRADNVSAWEVLAASVPLAGARLRFRFVGDIRSRANNTVVIAKPGLSSLWGRWVKPNWAAEVLNTAGQVIGSYPFTAAEEPTYVSGQRAQGIAVTLNVPSSGRIRAVYPSGVEAVNTLPVIVTPAAGGDPLEITSPSFPRNANPGEELTLATNYSAVDVTYTATEGTFGTGVNRHKWTAPARAGIYTITARKGGESVTVQVTVVPKLTPSSQSVQASGGGATREVSFSLNTNQGFINVGVSGGGTVRRISNADGTSTVIFTAGSSAGGPHTITASTQLGNATAEVTVTSATVPPIEISSPANNYVIEPGASVQIATNYLAAEVTFSATGGTFGTGANKDIYTAPPTAGSYVITITGPAGSLTDTITVKVPLRITPRQPAQIPFNGSVQFTANISPVIEWRLSTSGVGTLTQQGLFTAYAVPGQYFVRVRALVAGVEQDDEVPIVVSGEPLILTGGTSITVQPGATYRVQSNKSLADTTYTLSAGNGSFGSGADENLYTAPTDAGNYQFFVTYLNQVITVQVNVPVVLTPASASVLTAGVQAFTINADVVNYATTGWAVTGDGALSSKAIRGVTFTAGATPGTYTLTAITALGTVNATITVSASGPALAVTNGVAITLESKQTHQILVNYPLDGVTFTSTTAQVNAQGVFIAPDVAGVYTVTVAKASHVSVVVTFTVPLRITPTAITATPGQLVQFDVNYPSVTWTTSAGAGVISVAGLLTAGPNPGGPFTITASTLLGDVTAQVTITPVELIVYGPQSIELEPGAQHEVKTNFPNASLIFSPIGGGSFGTGSSANIYTAPLNAGDYEFRVTVQGGQATKSIMVRVPLRITPTTAQLAASASQQFQINSPFANWTVSSEYAGNVGTISGTGFYQASANPPPVVTITASALGQSFSVTVYFLNVFPYDPSYTVTVELDRRHSLALAEDGSRHGTVRGEAKERFELVFQNRELEELEAALAWWKDRYPEKPFLFHDQTRDRLVPVYYDSALRWEVAGPCQFDFSFRAVEV